jgi:hypothetical protein
MKLMDEDSEAAHPASSIETARQTMPIYMTQPKLSTKASPKKPIGTTTKAVGTTRRATYFTQFEKAV